MAIKKFSTAWKKSSKPSKQRKYLYETPLHIKQKLMRVHLSKELRKKYSQRNIGVKKGDKVKIMRGKFAKQEGKVNSVNLKRERILVEGIETIKKDGTKAFYPLHHSNLLLLELDLSDKKRKKKIESKITKKTP